ncbi:MAG TPA: hypothetical protein VGB81_16815 [Devosia sp.]
MAPHPMNAAVDDEDPDKSPVADKDDRPTVVRRKEDQGSGTKADLPGDSVQPGINEATDDPN